jgi:hypothetical protein
LPIFLPIADIAFANRADTFHDLVLDLLGGDGFLIRGGRSNALARWRGRGRTCENDGQGGGEQADGACGFHDLVLLGGTAFPFGFSLTDLEQRPHELIHRPFSKPLGNIQHVHSPVPLLITRANKEPQTCFRLFFIVPEPEEGVIKNSYSISALSSRL